MKNYDIIYADPPWEFSSRGARSGKFGDLDYPTMTINELCKLKVVDILNENSALFIWTPGALMMDCNKVIKAWGFTYVRVEAVWEKIKKSGKKHAVCGPWGMNEAEFLLMGIRGRMNDKQINKKNLNTIVKKEFTGKHSEKPQIFRDRIEYRFGKLSRLEMFARTVPDGWDVWGNEVKSEIVL